MEKKTVIIEVQTDQGVKSIDRLSAKFDEVYGEVLPLTGAIGELEDQLYEMAKAGDTSSEDFKALTAEAGRLKKVVAEVDREVDALSMTTANKLGGALGGVTAGFSIAQGAMGAMGAESQYVEEALLKVQSAMAISQGVQGFKEAIPALRAIGAAGVKAFGSLKAAIASTGIGLLLVAAGLVVSNWDKIQSSTKGATKSFNDYLNSGTKGAKALKWYLDALVYPITLALKGYKMLKDAITGTSDATRAVSAAEQKIHEKRMKALDEEREAQKKVLNDLDKKISLLEAEGKSTIKLRQEKLKLQKTEAEANLQSMQFVRNQIKGNGVMAKSYQDLVDNAKGVVDELEVQEVRLTQEIKAEQKERSQEYKAAQDDRLAKEADALEKQKEIWQQERDAQKEIMSIMKIDRDENYKSELDLLYERNQAEFKIKKEKRDKEIEAEKEKNRIIEANEKAAKQASIELTKTGLDTLVSLVDAFAGKNEASQRKAFKIKKVAAIAHTTIETYQAAQSAYASQMAIPTPDAPVRAAIAAGFAIAQGLAKVKAIASQKFESSSSGGGGGGGGSVPQPSSSSPANFNIVGNSGTNQLAETLSQSPIQAYVVGAQVTTQQALDRNKIKTSTW